MADARERRSQRRYIVVGMDVCLDGEPCPIIDISRSAVRVLLPRAGVKQDLPTDIVLRVQGRTRTTSREYKVRGWFIRGTRIEAVFGYDPPTKRWDATLRAHDTFRHMRRVEV